MTPARPPSPPGPGSRGGRRGASPSGKKGLAELVAERPPLRTGLASADPGPRVDRELFRRPSGRRASAGRVLGVGLLCFFLWTIFDANQLYHNAIASPPGARRSASIAFLRPIAAFSNDLGLSALVNWGNTELGRNGSPGSVTGSGTLPPLPPVSVAPSPPDHFADGLTARPHLGRGSLNLAELGGGQRSSGLPPIPPPTASRPLTILDVGDSIGEDLGFGLGDVFSNDPYVNLIQKAQIDTGLVDLAYYNWPSAFERYLSKYHPQAAVVMMGANDDSPIDVGGVSESPGSPPWAHAYAARVDVMMAEAIASKVHLVWVGLPPLQEGSVNSAFAGEVNGIVQSQLAKYPGVTYVPSWKVLSTPKGAYAEYLRINGAEVQVRYPDGIHLTPAGYDLLARSLIQPMQGAWHVNLHVP